METRVESFDDRYMGDGTVPSTGGMGGSAPPAVTGASYRLDGVDQADGTASPRETVTTKMADVPVPGNGLRAKGVDSFPDGV